MIRDQTGRSFFEFPNFQFEMKSASGTDAGPEIGLSLTSLIQGEEALLRSGVILVILYRRNDKHKLGKN
jgi:hypothetical protein